MFVSLAYALNCHVVGFEFAGWVWIQNLQHDNCLVDFVFAPTQWIQNLQHDILHKRK